MNMHSDISANVMTEEEYDRAREKLRETYGSGRSSIEARAKADMALAKFFVATGWTQDRLAKKEGLGRPYISNRLCFGRFLNSFVPAGTNLPKNLTENAFRGYWMRTETGAQRGARARAGIFPKGFGEEKRFDEVLAMIQEDEARLRKSSAWNFSSRS